MQKGSRKSLIVTLLSLFVAAPLAVCFGVFFMDDRQVLFISLCLVIIGMVPFFAAFEGRRPPARQLVIIAVLCAVGVAGRMALFMIPQFKPVAAVVIVAAVAFGPQTGFLVGTVTTLVSNFFFGQGPWTPWQMLGFGLVGFLAGILFAPGRLPHKRLVLCLYGGLATLLLYGGLVNLGTLLTANIPLVPIGIAAVYLAAVPFDLLHAAATVFFLFIAGEAMLKKLYRVREKYGF